ncbi:UDP-glucose dehydrogenase family protein [Rhodovibrio salinarum]|uniref:UDP-glucose 6-dehydrogenase n=1 Tax=Rhodovibrio salinarum TaxID=1087 RepID=A0A934QG56_9PROT|nr:UDP-glucose/GDP-mannose dehydrogenase family protein [Rhodovibrio salinarum]MBK1696159.1 UDP-glucose/GDP-mannose dehydrogenase family protein [Rhodovibrio salinarum]
MKIAMIGTGYVGLVSGVCFAELGFETVCIDKQADKIDGLERGVMPIYEHGLEEMVARNFAAGRISFSTDLAGSVADADAVFIAVGTPSDVDGRPDLSAVYAAAREIANAVTGYTVVVNKSTVPVGTGAEVARVIHETNPDADVDVASNPEFLREGQAIGDFMNPDRVLLGVPSPRAGQVLQTIYQPLKDQGAPVIETVRESAEIAKYAANSFLATKITFINQVADLCERAGADVDDVAQAIGLDPRIGSSFLKAGPGYGGSCFPKDTRGFASVARDYGSDQEVVDAVIEANENRKYRMAERIVDAGGGDLRGKTVAVLGLTFKPDTDDMRASPSLVIVPELQRHGAKVRAYCPGGMGNASEMLEGVDFCDGKEDAAHNADVVVVLTDWAEFKQMDLVQIGQRARGNTLIDLRNLFDPQQVLDAGFTYFSVGRPASQAMQGSDLGAIEDMPRFAAAGE